MLINIEDINRVRGLFDNLTTITYTLMQKTGYPEDSGKRRYDRLAHSVISEDLSHAPHEHVFVPRDHISIRTQRTVSVVGQVIVDPNTNVSDLNRHVKVPHLFMSGNPANAPEVLKAARALPQDTLEEKTNIRIGKQHAVDMIARINNMTHKPVTCLILDVETFELYMDRIAAPPAQVAANIRTTEERDGQEIVTGVKTTFHVLPSTSNFLDLTPNDLDNLYDIYTNTIGKVENGKPAPAPLLIQGGDGLAEVPKLAFAFQVLADFDRIFRTSVGEKATDRLKEILEDIRRSRSPNALSDAIDLEQALYLAFSLKMVEMQIKCMKQLSDFLDSKENDPNFATRHAKINELINNLVAPTYQSNTPATSEAPAQTEEHPMTNKVRVEMINQALIKESELSNHHQLTFLSPVRAEPKHYQMIKTLRHALTNRVYIESLALVINREAEKLMAYHNGRVTLERLAKEGPSVETNTLLSERPASTDRLLSI